MIYYEKIKIKLANKQKKKKEHGINLVRSEH